MENGEINYEAVLADLEAKKAAIDEAIAGIRRMMGQGQAVSTGVSGKMINPNAIPSDAFFGMSIPEAIRKYLGIVRKPRTTKDISEALEGGGITHTSKNFYATVSTTIGRMLDKEKGLAKIGSEYGLLEWYPGRKGKTSGVKEENVDPIKTDNGNPQQE